MIYLFEQSLKDNSEKYNDRLPVTKLSLIVIVMMTGHIFLLQMETCQFQAHG